MHLEDGEGYNLVLSALKDWGNLRLTSARIFSLQTANWIRISRMRRKKPLISLGESKKILPFCGYKDYVNVCAYWIILPQTYDTILQLSITSTLSSGPKRGLRSISIKNV